MELVMAVSKSVITDTELDLLKVLWCAAPLSARDITEQLYDEVSRSSMGTVQKLIARLEEKGMVHRDRSLSVHRFVKKKSPGCKWMPLLTSSRKDRCRRL